MNTKVMILIIILGSLSLILGCGTQKHPNQKQFMVNQLSGKYRTAYNGDSQRTRSYDGVRQYGDDNVAVIVTDSNGRSLTTYTKYRKTFNGR